MKNEIKATRAFSSVEREAHGVHVFLHCTFLYKDPGCLACFKLQLENYDEQVSKGIKRLSMI